MLVYDHILLQEECLREYRMKRFYSIYQYVAFLIFFPLSTYIWYKELGSVKNTLLVILLPIVVAYIIPAIGTNVTKLWKFNTKHRAGNFRIYHGFVFGSVLNLFGYMLYKVSPSYSGILESIFFAIISGSFIAFWNWYYDIYAVESGFMVVNNKPAYEKKSAHEIVADYAPVYFFMFGFIYALYLKCLEYYFVKPYNNFNVVVTAMYLVALIVPTLVYMCFSYIRHKDLGISEYKGDSK